MNEASIKSAQQAAAVSPEAPEKDLAAGSKSATQVTPMMVQYLAIKQQHPGYLLFYRMGDFYELFFDDARTAAAILGITLTKRGKHLDEDIPMCGVPVRAADSYLERLIQSGRKVAICEQTEDPQEAKKRGPKALVRREIARLVTPGTLTEETLLDSRSHNYLAALGLASAGRDLALAWLDMSTGDFNVTSLEAASLEAELARLEPGELLIPDVLLDAPEFRRLWRQRQSMVTPLPRSRFDSDGGARRLKALFKVSALDGFGDFSRGELAACGALVDYVELTQVGRLPPLKPPKRQPTDSRLVMDAATRTNLELTATLKGSRKGSLVAIMDKTVTGAGARLLQQRLTSPLTSVDEIGARLDSVDFFVEAPDLRGQTREHLRQTPDMARALSRVQLNRGGPRDLAAIRDGLDQGGYLRRLLNDALASSSLAGIPAELAQAIDGLGCHGDLVDELRRALNPDLPLLARDGGFISPGYHAPLDEMRRLRDQSRQVIAGLQARYADQTAIKSVKVRHNNVLGYFVEVSQQYGDRLMSPPLSETFIHRQTMANAVRFTTVELGELDTKITRAADQALALEQELFGDLANRVLALRDDIMRAADALAVLDVSSALAELAAQQRYARPHVEASRRLHIKQGRHPVVDAALQAQGDIPFVANDCRLGPPREGDSDDALIWLVTGPNMAGKSTFLRQNALIVILAQMGSFVPAYEARIGIVDRLFSRVGAADDLAQGRSTFMVEMVETAAILNQASERSLVILDEVGRGTATFDGLSIAWAVVEHLHDANRCRTLFATHFHELTALTGKLTALANVTVRVKEWQGEVVFLHEVTAGSADRSYGIQVAKLAGLPANVTERAEQVLLRLEQDRRTNGPTATLDDLPLFSSMAQNPADEGRDKVSEIEHILADIHADDLSPRKALEIIYSLKAVMRD